MEFGALNSVNFWVMDHLDQVINFITNLIYASDITEFCLHILCSLDLELEIVPHSYLFESFKSVVQYCDR